MGKPLYDLIAESTAFLQEREQGFKPQFGIILGSGLGGAVRNIKVLSEIPYGDIPNFPVSTVIGHKGSLIFAEYAGRHIAILSGRFHYYEGYSMQKLTFPLRVLIALGIETLIVTAAAGGLQANFIEGQILLLRDQINLMPDHPLRGPNDERLGVRFPDMSEAYSKVLRLRMHRVAEAITGNPLEEAVYAALAGPSLETPAEYAFLHHIGADLVGMSVASEVIVARHAEIPVLGLAVVSNVCYPPEAVGYTTAEMVVEVAENASSGLGKLIEGFIKS